MGATSKCAVCGLESPDTHPSRKGNKFCCRQHFNIFKKEHGTWNRGMTWKDMYNKNTYDTMNKRINVRGEEHFNYNRRRTDTILRNLLNNPMKTSKYKEEIKKMFKENQDKAIDFLLKNMVPDKHYAYQRKAYEKYGRKCCICGKTEGQIDVHHVDKNRKNNKIENLQVLCPKHHSEAHNNI